MSSSAGSSKAALASASRNNVSNGKKKPYPLYLGGIAASIAAFFTHPLDVAKVRIQTSESRSMITTLVQSVSKEGVRRGAFPGLSASLLRQMTYSMTRFSLYDLAKTALAGQEKAPALWKLALAGSIAGAAGGVAGNPADICLVRMISDTTKPPAERFRYRNAFDGVYQIARKEGAAALFRGFGPNTARAMLMNSSQLASYDAFKAMLLKTGYFQDGFTTHFSAGACAGTVATTVCQPFDVVKSRMMNARGREGVLDVVRRSFAEEGLSWTMRGWTPAWTRLLPNSLLVFVTLEQLRALVDARRAQA